MRMPVVGCTVQEVGISQAPAAVTVTVTSQGFDYRAFSGILDRRTLSSGHHEWISHCPCGPYLELMFNGTAIMAGSYH